MPEPGAGAAIPARPTVRRFAAPQVGGWCQGNQGAQPSRLRRRLCVPDELAHEPADRDPRVPLDREQRMRLHAEAPSTTGPSFATLSRASSARRAPPLAASASRSPAASNVLADSRVRTPATPATVAQAAQAASPTERRHRSHRFRARSTAERRSACAGGRSCPCSSHLTHLRHGYPLGERAAEVDAPLWLVSGGASLFLPPTHPRSPTTKPQGRRRPQFHRDLVRPTLAPQIHNGH